MKTRLKRTIPALLLILGTILASWAVAASAQAYLHVANATNYAASHMWRTFCNSSYNYCSFYPKGTGWYDRISDSYVRVEVYSFYKPRTGYCYRVFAVRGSDGSPYITTDGSSAYYQCTGGV